MRVYCEKHEATFEGPGECPACLLVEENAARVGALTRSVSLYAQSCVRIELALIELMQSQDRGFKTLQ